MKSNCKLCDNEFEVKKADQKFCKIECSDYWYNNQICVYCNKKIETKQKRTIKCCSKRCYRLLKRFDNYKKEGLGQH